MLPLEVVGDTVNYEFIRMPDSTGFGDYTETGQVIPVAQTARISFGLYLRSAGPRRTIT